MDPDQLLALMEEAKMNVQLVDNPDGTRSLYVGRSMSDFVIHFDAAGKVASCADDKIVRAKAGEEMIDRAKLTGVDAEGRAVAVDAVAAEVKS